MVGTISFFKSLDAKVQAELVKIFGQSAIDSVEAEIKTIFTSDVQVIFTDSINAAESLQEGGVPATGAQKQAAAFTQITNDLKSNGISLGQSAVNMGIELCVNLLKAKMPVA